MLGKAFSLWLVAEVLGLVFALAVAFLMHLIVIHGIEWLPNGQPVQGIITEGLFERWQIAAGVILLANIAGTSHRSR